MVFTNSQAEFLEIMLANTESSHYSLATMKHYLFLALCITGIAHAQNNNQQNEQQQRLEAIEKKLAEMESDGIKRFWLCKIKGSELMIAVDRIAAISKTQYVLDGGVLVDEVVIETNGGQALNRIYSLRPVTDAMASNPASKIIDRVRDVATERGSRLGTNLHEMVEKNYPTTSHARTVEFRVVAPEDLDVLYASLKDTWITGKGRVFTIK
jgi:hypothetical protein